MKKPDIHIYADGACKKNPGGVGGWGVVITDFVTINEYYGGDPETTNNRMELQAAISALSKVPANSTIKLHTDSQYVIRGMTEWIPGWLRRNWKSSTGDPVKNVDLWKQLSAAAVGHNITWVWVKGHSGDPGNERADLLANKGVDMIRNGTNK